MPTEKGVSSSESTKAKTPADERQTAAPSPESASQPLASPPAQPTTTVDDTGVMACYANFCRVSSSPEELILDLALNPNPMQTGDVNIKVSQRIVLNHYTAKRLLGELSMALQRHEEIFGVLETDIRKRVRGQ